MFKISTIVTCVAVIFISACKQESSVLKPEGANRASGRIANYNSKTITDEPYSVQLEYAQEHLKTLAKAALKQAHKSHFRKLVYEEASKRKWQQETSVLFSTLFTEGEKKQLGVLKDMEESVGAEALKKSINAFAGIEGKVLYPTIYIPSFEKRSATIKKAASGATDLEAPVVVIYAEDKDLLPAYKLDANGNLVEAGFMVDEAYATENEVWVLSLNESAKSDLTSVKNCGHYPCEPLQPNRSARESQTSDASVCADGNTSSAHLLNDGIDVYVGVMEIREHKESWAGGGSEIRIVKSTMWGNGKSVYNGSIDNSPFWAWYHRNDPNIGPVPSRANTESQGIAFFSRDDVRYKRRKSINLEIANRWGGTVPVMTQSVKDDRRDHMIYFFYEDDEWPHPMLKVTFTTYWNGGSNTVTIQDDNGRSNDPMYVSDNVNWYKIDANYACFGTVTIPYVLNPGYRGNASILYDFYTTIDPK